MAPDLELLNAVLAQLRADSAVAAVVGDRIYDRVPMNAEGLPSVSSPYISCDYSASTPDDADDLEAEEIEFQLDAWSWGDGEAYASAEVRKIARAVKRCLHDAEFPLAVNALATLQHSLTRILRDTEDGVTNHAAMRFVATVEIYD